jgi:drug/metabolite transporter (DMT)-like permease
MNTQRNMWAYVALGGVCIIWGTTYLVLRIGVTQFPPFLFSMIRFLLAGPILLGILLALGKLNWPDRRTVFNQALCGLLMVTLGVSVVGWAEMYVSSSVAAVICSVMPIWTIIINLIVSKEEKPNWLIALGASTGLAGIVLIFSEHLVEFADPNYKTGIILIFLSNLCWAIGSNYIKRKNTNSDPFMNAGLQMLFGGIFLIPFSLALDDYRKINFSGSVVFALTYMILVGSVAAYACYSYAIKKLPMTIVSLYAYINPIVAVVLGWLILSEKLNVQIGVAIFITIAGIWLVNRGYQLKSMPLKPFTGIRSLLQNLKTISLF